MSKTKKIYISPSPHGTGVNKCLHSSCYEDKHTRPISESIAKHLRHNGFEVKVGAINQDIYARMNEANKWGADLYVPVHTNACGTPSARYVLFMSWNTTGKYAKLFDNIFPYIDTVYDGKIYHRQAQNLIEINTPKAQVIYCEFGFHTNKTDCNKYIHDPEIFGKAFAKGICKHYGVIFKDVTTTNTVIKPTTTKPTASAKKNVITVDGIWGVNTTKYLQKLLKTTADGIVSNQLNNCKKYLPAVHNSSWKFNAIGYGGSPMIKKFQKTIGVSADGYMGTKTVKALQSFLKRKGYSVGAVDGIMGSSTVTALQKYLNAQFK